MADQAINALSTKTAPETSDQLLLVGAGEPQLIDYDKLADAILNKITSKNYALDAGTMTLTAALNALNGNALGFNNGMIRDYTIKNDKYYSILPLGCYELQNASLTYFPTRWGILLHFRGDINYGIFIAIHTDGTVYVRLYSLENNDWYTGWVKLAKG